MRVQRLGVSESLKIRVFSKSLKPKHIQSRGILRFIAEKAFAKNSRGPDSHFTRAMTLESLERLSEAHTVEKHKLGLTTFESRLAWKFFCCAAVKRRFTNMRMRVMPKCVWNAAKVVTAVRTAAGMMVWRERKLECFFYLLLSSHATDCATRELYENLGWRQHRRSGVETIWYTEKGPKLECFALYWNQVWQHSSKEYLFEKQTKYFSQT